MLQRFLGRLRYGLLMQEVLDRFAKAGLVIRPYFIVIESAPIESDPVSDPRCTLRMLTSEDAAAIEKISIQRTTEQAHIDRLLQPGAACLGIFYDGELAGYTWARRDAVPLQSSLGLPLIQLQLHEAYLFGMFVTPRRRGLRLAGVLRRGMLRELTRRAGIRLFYSISLALNRSTRRFKDRLAAQEVELRLCLKLGSHAGIDLRLWRREPHLRSPRFKRVPPASEAKNSV